MKIMQLDIFGGETSIEDLCKQTLKQSVPWDVMEDIECCINYDFESISYDMPDVSESDYEIYKDRALVEYCKWYSNHGDIDEFAYSRNFNWKINK